MSPRVGRNSARQRRRWRNRYAACLMTALVPKLREAFVQAFGGKDYEREIAKRREMMQKELSGQLEVLKTEARADGLDIVQTEHGMLVVATGPDGEPVALDTFAPPQRKKLEAAAARPLFGINSSRTFVPCMRPMSNPPEASPTSSFKAMATWTGFPKP